MLEQFGAEPSPWRQHIPAHAATTFSIRRSSGKTAPSVLITHLPEYSTPAGHSRRIGPRSVPCCSMATSSQRCARNTLLNTIFQSKENWHGTSCCSLVTSGSQGHRLLASHVDIDAANPQTCLDIGIALVRQTTPTACRPTVRQQVAVPSWKTTNSPSRFRPATGSAFAEWISSSA